MDERTPGFPTAANKKEGTCPHAFTSDIDQGSWAITIVFLMTQAGTSQYGHNKLFGRARREENRIVSTSEVIPAPSHLLRFFPVDSTVNVSTTGAGTNRR